MWTRVAQMCFEHFKQVMSSCPVLALPNFTKPFELHCDASGDGIGAVLMQEKHPIAFESRKLRGVEKSYSVYDREMLAIMHALAKFQSYLVGGRFVIKTDHNNIKYFMSERDLNDRQQKWVTKLQAYDFDIEFVKGKKNVVADALSRRPHICALAEISGDWRDWIIAEYVGDAWASGLILGTIQDDLYEVIDGLIRVQDRVYLIPSSHLREAILKAFHDAPTAGHPGVFKN